MNIIPLIKEFANTFNENFNKNFDIINLEQKIMNVGDNLTLNFYRDFLNYLDENFKNSKERKKKYRIKYTREKTLITTIGVITVNSTVYYDKVTKERYVFLRDLLFLKPYQRITNEAESRLVNYAEGENMSQAAKHALRNTAVSRSTVSRKIQLLKGSIEENIVRAKNTPDTIYIEIDEIHANLQHGGNRICPCAIVHEGYEDSKCKRKKLKNIHYFATSTLTYSQLYEVIYDYIDKRYDIDKIKTLFISGDGANGIKNYNNSFPNAIFVLDKFHYWNKHLKYIFKGDRKLMNLADNYIRNDMIEDFKKLVECQIEKFPDQEDKITEHMNYIINNSEGIKNQNNPLYKCPCSMEGHVSQAFARYITSSPYGFSENGLKNKLKLLVYRANRYELTINDYYKLKYGNDEYEEINKRIKELSNIKINKKLYNNNIRKEYKINVNLPTLDNPADNNRLKEIITPRDEVYII